MPTKRQIAKAGKLWGLLLITSTDNGDESGDVVRDAARKWAAQALKRMGYVPEQFKNEEECLSAVSRDD